MIIHFIRHGISKANNSRTISTPDTPLVEGKRYELDEAKNFLSGRDLKNIYVSPYLRARQTADYLGLKNYEIENRVHEMNFGDLGGLTHEEALKKTNGDFKNILDGFISYRINGGESYEDVKERVEDFLENVQEIDGEIAVVTHYIVMVAVTNWTLNSQILPRNILIKNGGRLTIEINKENNIKGIVF